MVLDPLVIVGHSVEQRETALASLRHQWKQIESAITEGRDVAIGYSVTLANDVTRPGDETVRLQAATERELRVRYRVRANQHSAFAECSQAASCACAQCR